jgi:hypothetical protein
MEHHKERIGIALLAEERRQMPIAQIDSEIHESETGGNSENCLRRQQKFEEGHRSNGPDSEVIWEMKTAIRNSLASIN